MEGCQSQARVTEVLAVCVWNANVFSHWGHIGVELESASANELHIHFQVPVQCNIRTVKTRLTGQYLPITDRLEPVYICKIRNLQVRNASVSK